MKPLLDNRWGWAGLVVSLLRLTGCSSPAPPAAPPAPAASTRPAGQLFHFSLLDAFLAGTLDGDYTIGQLREHGDFGLGAFNHFDGELLALDGQVYQVRADGRAYLASDTLKTPFSFVHFFRADRRLTVRRPLPQAALQHYLNRVLAVENSLYGLKITGTFARVRARSNPPIYRRPYPTVASVIDQQRVFSFDTVSGTFVGYRLPAFLKGTNIPGYHFHLLTADRQRGGHVLDYTLLNGVIDVDSLSSYSVRLPGHPDFYRARLNQDRSQELKKVE